MAAASGVEELQVLKGWLGATLHTDGLNFLTKGKRRLEFQNVLGFWWLKIQNVGAEILTSFLTSFLHPKERNSCEVPHTSSC